MRSAQDRAVFAQMSICKFFHFMKIFFRKKKASRNFYIFCENFFKNYENCFKARARIFIKMKIISKKFFFHFVSEKCKKLSLNVNHFHFDILLILMYNNSVKKGRAKALKVKELWQKK